MLIDATISATRSFTGSNNVPYKWTQEKSGPNGHFTFKVRAYLTQVLTIIHMTSPLNRCVQATIHTCSWPKLASDPANEP